MGTRTDIDPALAESLRRELPRCASQIEQAIRDGKPMDAVGTCCVLQQVAGVIGMVSLGESAANAVQRLSGNLDLADSSEVLAMIVKECRSAA